MELKSKASLVRACEKLGVTPEAYCTVKIRPRAPDAKALALDLYREAKGGPIYIRGGTEDAPAHVYAELPEPRSPGLDDLALNPQLVHLHVPRVVLSFGEDDMHRRYHIPSIWSVKKRVTEAYAAASRVVGFELSFEEWSLETAQLTRKPRDSPIWSSHIGEFPYNVGVQAGGLSPRERGYLVAQWLDLLGEVRVIEATLKAPFSDLGRWLQDTSARSEKVSGNTWGLNTLPTPTGVSRDALLDLFGDVRMARQTKSWELRVHRIQWQLEDPSLNTTETENAVVLVQEPRAFHRTIHLGFPLEDMDSPRFQGARATLQSHIPADLGNLPDWDLVGDPRDTPRGLQLAQQLGRLRAITRDFFERNQPGPSSALLMDSRGNIPRRASDRQKGAVAFKQTVVRVMQRGFPEFSYSESTSWTERGMLDFVRRSPSGTRNWIVVARDKYGGSFGIDAAVCAFPCAEVHLDLAGQDPMETANPGWGLRGLLELMNHGPAGASWTWTYKDQSSLEAGLAEAMEKAPRVLLPLFSELEPVLCDIRLFGRG